MTDRPKEPNDPKIVSIVDRFKKADTEITPVKIDEGPKSWEPGERRCEHKQYRVDAVLPKVTCAACEEVLDPYYALRLIGKYFEKRDHRWDAIKDQEKKSAQFAAAELHRVTGYEARRGEAPEGAYMTRDRRYVVQHTPKGWEVAWNGGVIRTTGTLSTAKTFIRDHVRTNWGKEEARSIAQHAAGNRNILPDIKLEDAAPKPTTIEMDNG